ncbi:MAG: hypothetical protein IIX65_07305, partial [Lachnospiraceae bacterium]|nr:hypothetical protein [Lachnospiraceae bacterium]
IEKPSKFVDQTPRGRPFFSSFFAQGKCEFTLKKYQQKKLSIVIYPDYKGGWPPKHFPCHFSFRSNGKHTLFKPNHHIQQSIPQKS